MILIFGGINERWMALSCPKCWEAKCAGINAILAHFAPPGGERLSPLDVRLEGNTPDHSIPWISRQCRRESYYASSEADAAQAVPCAAS